MGYDPIMGRDRTSGTALRRRPTPNGLSMDETAFRYASRCSAPGCRLAPRYKIAATWTSGTLRELKNYGLACEGHRDALLKRGKLHRQGLALAEDEVVGPVEVFALAPSDGDGKRGG